MARAVFCFACLLVSFCFGWLCGMQDLSSPTRDWTLVVEVRSLNHWTSRDVPGAALDEWWGQSKAAVNGIEGRDECGSGEVFSSFSVICIVTCRFLYSLECEFCLLGDCCLLQNAQSVTDLWEWLRNDPNADASSYFIRVGALRGRIMVGVGGSYTRGSTSLVGFRATGLGNIHGIQLRLAVKLWVRQT